MHGAWRWDDCLNEKHARGAFQRAPRSAVATARHQVAAPSLPPPLPRTATARARESRPALFAA
eukprot:1215932-Lingulodinium_polyedra.AAC.1